MKKVKVIFPDNSITEIEESDLPAAIKAGAKIYTEKAQKKLTMTFPDGSIADINESDVVNAEAAGAVKKKSSLGNAGAIALEGGTENLPTVSLTDKQVESGTGINDNNIAQPELGSQSAFNSIVKGAIGGKKEIPAEITTPSLFSEEKKTIFDIPFLDRDIERKYDLSLSNPEFSKPANKYSLLNDYYKNKQVLFDARKEMAKHDIKKDVTTLETYNTERIAEINSDIQIANERLKEIRSNLGGADNMKVDELLKITEEQDDLNKQIAHAQDYKEKLKSSIAVETIKKIVPDYLQSGKTFDPRELGREILKASDPEMELQFKDAEKGASGLPQLQMAAMERLGLDATKNFLSTQPQSDEVKTLLSTVEGFEKDFDTRNFELTAQRVREKLGVYFYNKGRSGVFGYKGSRIEEAINDPESGLTDVEKKIALDYVLPTEKKLIFSTGIPGSGFFRSGKDAIERSIVGLGNTISAQLGDRTDADRAYENLNREVEQSRFSRPGESQSIKSELASLNKKEIEKGLTVPEKEKKLELEKLVDVRSGWSQFSDGVGDLTGQVIQMALLTKSVGAVGKLATGIAEGGGVISGGLTSSAIGTALSNQTVGLFLNSYFQTYDNYRSQALEIMPGDKNAANRKAYATVMSAVEGFSERIFNDVKVLDAFTKGISPTVADITTRFINKEISQQVAKEELRNAFSKYATPFAKEFAKSTFQESTEEGIVDLADGISQSIFGGQPFDINKTGDQAIHTFLTTALYSPLVSGMASHGAARQNANESAYYKAAIVDMARKPVPYLQSVDQLLLNGTITQDQANEKIQLINSAQKYLKELPAMVVTPNPDKKEGGFVLRQLDFPEISSYMTHRLNEGILTDEMEKVKSDPVAVKNLQTQIDRSVKIRQGIADGQIAITPNNIEVTEDEKLATELGISTPGQVNPDDLIGTKYQNKTDLGKSANAEVLQLEENRRLDLADINKKNISVDQKEKESSIVNDYYDNRINISKSKTQSDATKIHDTGKTNGTPGEQVGAEAVNVSDQSTRQQQGGQSNEDVRQAQVLTNTEGAVQNAASSVNQTESVQPIRQLGTGANVYFETDKYRVNDDLNKDGGVWLNIGDADGETPLANIKFDNANEAVFVAKKLQENAPDGLHSDFHNVDKIIDGFKKEYSESLLSKEQTPTALRDVESKKADIEKRREDELKRPYKQIKDNGQQDREYRRISGDYPKVRELVNKYVDWREKFDMASKKEQEDMLAEKTGIESELDKLVAVDSRLIKNIDEDIFKKDNPDYEAIRNKYLDQFSEQNRYENKVNAKYDAELKSQSLLSKEQGGGEQPAAKPKVRVSAEQLQAAQPTKEPVVEKPVNKKSNRQDKINKLRDRVDSYNKMPSKSKERAAALKELQSDADELGGLSIDFKVGKDILTPKQVKEKGHDVSGVKTILRYTAGGNVQRRSSQNTAASVKSISTKQVYKEVGKVDVPNTAKGLALHYIASGGEVSETDVDKEVAGTVKRARLNTGVAEQKSTEVKARDYAVPNGNTIKQIAHNIWEGITEDQQKKITDRDIINELIDVMQTHNTRLSAAKEFLNKYGEAKEGQSAGLSLVLGDQFDPTSYSQQTQDAVNKIISDPAILSGLALKGEDGYRLSLQQQEEAVKALQDGNPTVGSKAIYDFFENATDGNILLEDDTTGNEVEMSIADYFSMVESVPVEQSVEKNIEDLDLLNTQLGDDAFGDLIDEELDNLTTQENESSNVNPSGKATEVAPEPAKQDTSESANKSGSTDTNKASEKTGENKVSKLSNKLKGRLASKELFPEEKPSEENDQPAAFQVRSGTVLPDQIVTDFIREELNNKTDEADILQALIDNGYTGQVAQELVDDTKDERQITLGVIGQIGQWLGKVFGGKQNVFIAKDQKSLMQKVKQVVGNISFRLTNAVFETRDGNPIGFNYDTDKVARERFDFSKMTKIGEGSDRVVFDMGDGNVLKVAKTARGLEQNIYEGSWDLVNEGIIPEVKERGLNYVVTKKIQPASKANSSVEFEREDNDTNEITTTTLNQMLSELGRYSSISYNNRDAGLQRALNKYGLGWVLNYDLLWNDFTAKRNWGIDSEGQPVHLDGGTFGGVESVIQQYSGKKNLDNAEFRDIYNKSRALKKQYADTDRFTMFQGKLTNEQQAAFEQLTAAQNEYQAAKSSFESKRKELDKGLAADQTDLFGERKSTAAAGNQLFDERASTTARDKAIQPAKERLQKAEDAVNVAKKKFDGLAGSKTAQTSLFMKTPTGDILGFTANGKIYLNGAKLNPETPIHEAGHIWSEWAKDNATDLYDRGRELIKNSQYLMQVKASPFYQSEAKKLPAAERETYYEHEALATAIGDKGAKFIADSKKKGFAAWAKELWDRIGKALGFKDIHADELQNLTLDEFAERAAIDILKADVTPRPKVIKSDVVEVAKDIRADKVTYNEAIEGKDEKFIEALDKELYGSKRFNMDQDAFRENIRKQRDFGTSKDDVIANLASAKKITKKQMEIIDEVFLENEATEKSLEELREAMRNLAKGIKPKKVLQRLSTSDVTSLVLALKDHLSYAAVSNKQLEDIADYIIETIDINDVQDYIEKMYSNNLTDVVQLLRAKAIVELQKAGNNALAKQLVSDMADDAVSAGRQTQSLRKAYEILQAKGNPAVRTEFARRYAEKVRQTAFKMNQRLTQVIQNKNMEIKALNEKIHEKVQKSPGLLDKLKNILNNICGVRTKK